MQKEISSRENNYDLLRIFCCISIVMLHASGFFVKTILAGGGGDI